MGAKGILAKLTPAPRGIVTEENGVAMTEDGVDPNISLGGHICLSAFFVIAVLAYTILAFVAYFTRPELETFVQLPASQFDAFDVVLEASCSNPPYCGPITITANYSLAPGCESHGTVVVPFAATVAKTPATKQALCYADTQLYSVDTANPITVNGLQVDFKGLNPGFDKSTTPETPMPAFRATGSVRVTAPSIDAAFGRLVNMDTWQVKTLVLGQNIKRRDGIVVSRSVYPITIQYEGKRPVWRSTLFIALAPLANVYDTERPGTLLDTIASIGGAAGIVSAFLILAVPVVALITPGNVVSKTEVDAAKIDDTEPIASTEDATVDAPATQY